MKSNWNKYPQIHPEIGQEVLIFCHGFDISGEIPFSHYELAFYDVHTPTRYNRRKFAFYQSAGYENYKKEDRLDEVWAYSDVSHWVELPDKPKVRR